MACFIASNLNRGIFPQEVIDLFLDEIRAASVPQTDALLKSDDDEPHPIWWKTLCHCLLVSRSFYYSARKHVFSKMKLTVELVRGQRNVSYSCAKLCKIFEANQALVMDVKVFKLDIQASRVSRHGTGVPIQQDETDSDGVPGESENPLAIASSQVPELNDKNLPRVLNLLSKGRLHTLEIVCSRSPLYYVNNICDEIQASLLNIRCSPLLKTLVLDRLLDPSRAFITADPMQDQLQKLVLRNMHVGRRHFPLRVFPKVFSTQQRPMEAVSTATSRTEHLPLQNLRSLEVTRYPQFLDFIRSGDRFVAYTSVDFPLLEAIFIESSATEVDNQALLQGSPSLKYFSFEIGYPHGHISIPNINLSCLPLLRAVRFSSSNNVTEPSHDLALVWMVKLLQSTKPGNDIETIILDFTDDTPITNLYIHLPRSMWAPLDEALSDSFHFPVLKKVSVRFGFKYWGWLSLLPTLSSPSRGVKVSTIFA